MPTATTGQTLYSLVFGGEALIPVELEVYSPRVEHASNFEPQNLLEWRQQNDDGRRLELDLLEGRRELAALQQAEHKRRVMTYYNKHVRRRPLEDGDLVLKLRTTAGRDMAPGKLDSNWEGPFITCNVLESNTYKLARQDGTLLTRTWNGNDLKKFYS
ncbi:hypothetical protein AXF42_Ash017498 [Apostasia shenzhenica]|uniref:Uncharacterized protein n=1 Tax=Apostasia shenzhenica TaxID=1088818 RepID=A0A2I0A348_9ASPA|nr:hypothetical protein AXF42_Ash017498 [Apostasia shenzhenica]